MESFNDIVLPEHANPIVIEWLKSGKLKIMPSGCWEWQNYKNKQGYGSLRFKNMDYRAHRLAVFCGKQFIAMHSCDNPPCCNPWHLREGTQHENAIDKKSKKRGLKIGDQPRCLCGLQVATGSKDCPECRSIRLGKPPCYCGETQIYKGLCRRHYQQDRKTGDIHVV